jgi:probable HAF family extracellular repeat protein
MYYPKPLEASHAEFEERTPPRLRWGFAWRLAVLWLLLPLLYLASPMRVSLAASVAQLQLVNISPLIRAIDGNPKTVRIDDVAYDGSAAVGSFANPPEKYEGRRFFIYTRASGMQEIEDLYGHPVNSMHISGNGAVVWGTNYDYRRGTYAGVFRWTREGGVQEFGSFGQRGLKIGATSADGQVVAGSFTFSSSDPVFHAFRYSQARGFEDLGAMGADSAIAHGISGDARWVVGHLQFREGSVAHAFFHSESVGPHHIAPHSGSSTFASGISNDGSVVVGTYCNGWSGFVAACTRAPFVYTRKTGVKSLPGISAHSIVSIVVSPDGTQLGGAYMDSDSESYIFTGTIDIE